MIEFKVLLVIFMGFLEDLIGKKRHSKYILTKTYRYVFIKITI
jgi:hypothetical protein